MFIQVIQGRTSEAAALKEASDRWYRELAPGAHGWLGGTAGVTDDGTFIALERFESAEAARRNSDRPEQGRWWAETAKLFDGEVTFHDCTDVEVVKGGSDAAGFVQIIQGRVTDTEGLRKFVTGMDSAEMSALRPDVMGSVTALHGDGGYTTAIYFTSEAEAREGERKEMPAEMQARMGEMMQLHEGEVTYYDLREPWLY
jgi:hypothetical protein